MKYLPVSLLGAVLCFANAQVRFDNYQVYQVIPETQIQLDTLRELRDNRDSYSFWTDITFFKQPVDIMVPPHLQAEFQEIALRLNLTPELKIENIQVLIDEEGDSSKKSASTFNWIRYQKLDEIHAWLRSLEQQYPDNVKVIKGGQSYEGREILGIKLSFKSGNKGVLVEGGIHAREWISPATVTYITNEFLTSNDPAVREVAESRDWYIFPSVNPDGYVYTHTKNRLWRKTRTPYPFCYGADPNRNWGYKWNSGGTSNQPCAETYAGPKAFSEIETKSLSEFIDTIASNLDSYIAFHSYSQLLLIPFGHNGLEVPQNDKELHTIGNNAAKVLARRYGTKYKVGNIPEIIYVASGGSMDWAVGKYRHIRIAYTYELRDTGRYGFLLPADQIIPTAEETLDSLVSIFQQADA